MKYSAQQMYSDCYYHLIINDIKIDKFSVILEFKDLLKRYIRNKISEQIQNGKSGDVILFQGKISIDDWYNRRDELNKKGEKYPIPLNVYSGQDRLVKTLNKYLGKNIYGLIDMLPIRIA